ncbi:hypothetical protein FEE96_18055 [Parasedimentitalea maritima]|uniref:Uncharacterized protein n=1 Tax=Parasedimentitalea maritima TaxID=2578117 RepID=A0ABY2UQM7_9RHOB|nr:hypothetical protein [Zongyanglinia marina]TLP58337.1 hypothetical protein FEE96_18055 [Zongyanglinia marina]
MIFNWFRRLTATSKPTTRLEENRVVLNAIQEKTGTIHGPKEIEFFCRLLSRETALHVRKILFEVLPPNQGKHVFVQSAGGATDICVTLLLPVCAEQITVFEALIDETCREFGGENVSWGVVGNQLH